MMEFELGHDFEGGKIAPNGE